MFRSCKNLVGASLFLVAELDDRKVAIVRQFQNRLLAVFLSVLFKITVMLAADVRFVMLACEKGDALP